MTKEDRIKARNASYEAMIMAQGLIDMASSSLERELAGAIYRAHWALYLILKEESLCSTKET